MAATLELVIKKGPSAGRVVSLDGCRSVTIGRAPGNMVVLPDEKISSHHARLDVNANGVILTDVGSRNGTFVDGKPVHGSRLLPSGVEVALGVTVLELRWRERHISDPHNGNAAAAAVAAAVDTASRAAAEARVARERSDQMKDVVFSPATHPSQRNLTRSQRNLAILSEVGDLISTEREPDRFLARLMDLIFDVLPADRGVLLLVDEDGEARPRVKRRAASAGSSAHADDIHVSRAILGKALGGMSILTADAGSDVRLAARISIVAQNIRSAMCVPIRGRRKTVGAIYVDTTLSIGVFGKDDLEMLSTVGVLTGTALENIQLFRENLQQERMAAIGKVIAGLGHDIRNTLAALKGGMYLIDQSLRAVPDPEVRTAWEVVRHGHESIAALVQDMVNYSKAREPDWKLSDVNQVVLSALAIAREYAREKGVRFNEMLDPTIGPFWFDPQSVERCVHNLLTNAVDAVAPGRGTVSVQTQVDDAHRTVRIVVKDDGEGIPEEYRDRVFDLLFSTKGQRGTGFGLAITKKIVEEHAGHVAFRSDAAAGTTFTIELPLREEQPVPAAAAVG
jgi:two-component system, NtrC family, sensor kinase